MVEKLRANIYVRYAYLDPQAATSEALKYCDDYPLDASYKCLVIDSSRRCIRDASCDGRYGAVCEVPYFDLKPTGVGTYESLDLSCRENGGRMLSKALLVPFYKRLSRLLLNFSCKSVVFILCTFYFLQILSNRSLKRFI